MHNILQVVSIHFYQLLVRLSGNSRLNTLHFYYVVQFFSPKVLSCRPYSSNKIVTLRSVCALVSNFGG